MFARVADVENYPQFLPLCEGMTVRSRRPLPEGEEIVATMQVGYKAIKESFTSRVTLVPAKLSVKAEYIDGPFSHLVNRWTFADQNRIDARTCQNSPHLRQTDPRIPP